MLGEWPPVRVKVERRVLAPVDLLAALGPHRVALAVAVRKLVKTSLRPSGDQAGKPSSIRSSLKVSWRTPDPSAFMTKIS
jgi:hypothetical protein